MKVLSRLMNEFRSLLMSVSRLEEVSSERLIVFGVVFVVVMRLILICCCFRLMRKVVVMIRLVLKKLMELRIVII